MEGKSWTVSVVDQSVSVVRRGGINPCVALHRQTQSYLVCGKSGQSLHIYFSLLLLLFIIKIIIIVIINLKVLLQMKNIHKVPKKSRQP